jgi:hypothetical protein
MVLVGPAREKATPEKVVLATKKPSLMRLKLAWLFRIRVRPVASYSVALSCFGEGLFCLASGKCHE